MRGIERLKAEVGVLELHGGQISQKNLHDAHI
jgi:hypothetical protein